MMWIQTALPFFIKRIKSALGSHSYSSAGSSCLSLVKSHQHLRYRQRCQSSSQSRAFHVGCIGTSPLLIWILLNHFGFHNTGRQRNSNSQPAINWPWDHTLLQTQPCKSADDRQIHSRQIAAGWPQTLLWAQGRGKLGGTKKRVPKREVCGLSHPGINRGARGRSMMGQ